MKRCLTNLEGIDCPFPVVGGGRCEYHQIPEFAPRHIRRSMKKHKPNKKHYDKHEPVNA